MNFINDAFISAILADATYALNRNNLEGYTGDDLFLLLSNRMTPSLAKYISDNFTVVTHKETDDTLSGGESGFDATVWRHKGGKIYVSFTGTQADAGLKDLITDADLTFGNGVPSAQVINMVNWWLQLTTPKNEMAIQVAKFDIPLIPADGIRLMDPVPGKELVVRGSSVIVNGHSLGGGLAGVFGQIFGGSTVNVEEINTFNSAGYNPLSYLFIHQLQSILPYASGSVAGGQHNFFAENGVSATTREWLNIQFGSRIALSQEHDALAPIPNHYMYKITDMLALGNMMAMLDPTMSFESLNEIVDLGSNDSKASYESILDGFRKIFGVYGVQTPVGDVDGSALSRTGYYENLFALQEESNFKNLVGNVNVINGWVNVDDAKVSFNQFLSLYFGVPFILTAPANIEILLKGLHPDLYAAWSADQNLGSEDRLLGKANFSDEWYQDSAAYLSLLLERNKSDIDKLESSDPGGKDALYIKVENDHNDAHRIYSGSTNAGNYSAQPYAPWVILGTMEDNDNATRGGNGNDRIYGLGGDDKLSGLDGHDLLNGGAGDDELLGGDGVDLLLGGDGNDILDGGGANDLLNGGEGNDELKGAEGHDSLYGEDGDDEIDGNDGNDSLRGGSGKDELSGGDGIDLLFGDDGDDVLYGNKGRDLISGGQGDDLLSGGEGNDSLYGNLGDDTYEFEGDFGHDLVHDHFGDGKIVVNGVTLSSFALYQGSFIYRDPTDSFQAIKYTEYGVSTIVIHSLAHGESSLLSPNVVTIKNWRPGELGLTFDDSGVAPPSIARPPVAAPRLPPSPPRDPLALDLNGDGVVNTLPMSRGIHFDLDNSGFAERTSWVAPEDGLLILDRNNNNFIDGGSELFGTETLLSNGKYAKHGFEALAEFDVNLDGAVDADDAVYSSLRVWRDANSNGIADSGELKTLSELNVKSITTGYTNINTRDSSNVEHREAGTFTYNNSTQGITNTLWFESDRRITVPVTELQGNAPISDDIKKLPNVIGFGNTYSLHQAMAVDTSGELQEKVQRFSVELNPEKRRELLREILVLWTGTGGVAAGSRGDKVDATSLAIMESFWGQPAVQDKPFGEYATSVNQAYLHLEQSIYSQLMAGSHMRDLLGLSNFTEVNGSWSADYSLVVDLILNDLLSGDEFSPGKLIEFVEVVRGINPYSTEMVAPLLTTIVGNAAVLSAAERDTIINALYAENLIIKNVASGGAITGNNADNLMYGSEATDQMRGNSGEDILIGEGGNDTLYGMDDADHLIGGTGGDWLEGGAGDDAYYYRLGDGADTIKESSGFDSITFGEGINALNIKVIRLLDNIILEMPDGGSIFIQDFRDHFGNVNVGAIERIRFINNKEWDLSEITQRSIHTSELDDHLSGYSLNDTIHAGGGADRILGLSGDDDLAGGDGSDFIDGGSGNDIYRFSRGDGIDLIEDSGGFDTLVFFDIKSTDVFVHRNGSDDYFILKNGEMVRVSGLLSDGERDKAYQIEKVIFADTVWDAATIEQKILEGRVLQNVKFGGNSWDEIDISTASSVEIYGLEGDDYLQGGAGNDTIDGGAGLNFLEGREGRDTYLIGEYSSKNFIEYFRGDADRVLFAEGISSDEVRVRLIPGRDESYLEKGVLYKYIIPHDKYWNLELVSGDSVTYIDSLFKYDPQTYGAELDSPSLSVGTVEFFDGTVWTYSDLIMQALKASSADDVINGTITADFVQGLDGSDTIKSYSGNDSVNGGAGDDQIETGRDNDDISGGLGNDSLSDERGNDLYRFAAGEGVDTISDLHGLDALVFGAGITKEQTFLTADGDDQIVTFANSTDKIIIKNGALPVGNNYADQKIEIFRFANGDEWNFDPKSMPQRKEGNANDEVLVGGYGNDTLIGNQGNDTLQGEAGDDEYHYKSGDGFDLIYDTGGTDKVILGAGITPDKVSIRRSFNAFIVSVDGQDAFSISIPYSTDGFDENSFIESLVFSATGEVWDLQTIISKSLISTAGNDTLYGSHLSDVILGEAGRDELYGEQGNDTLVGGIGNDYLVGGAGNDLYRFEQGAGTDVINDIMGNDVIEFGSGILPADISVTRNEFDLILKVKNSNPITINGFFESTVNAIRSVNNIQAIEEVVFATGERWSLDQLLAKISFLGTDSANTIYGLDTNNVIDAKGGNDSVFAGGGNDTLIGGTGMDTLHGEAGDDLLQGGDGDDELNDFFGNNIFVGGKGIDRIFLQYGNDGQGLGTATIRYGVGDGTDYIYGPSHYNRIELGAGITRDMVFLKSQGEYSGGFSYQHEGGFDLYLKGTNDKLIGLIDNNQFEIVFSDNSVLKGAELSAQVNKSIACLSADGKTITGQTDPELTLLVSYRNQDNTITVYPELKADTQGNYSFHFGFGIKDPARITLIGSYANGAKMPLTVIHQPKDMSVPNVPSAQLDSSGYVITGFARPGTTINVSINGNHLGSVSTDKITGAYLFVSPVRLVHGETIAVVSNVNALIESVPATISAPNSSVAPDSITPEIPTGNFDPQGTSISGSAEPGTLVFATPLFGSRVLGSAVAGQDGTYKILLNESIIDGSSVSVVSVDQANNRSYGEIKSLDLTIPMPVIAQFDTTGKYVSGSAESSVTGGHQVIVMNSSNTTVLGTIMLPAHESNYKITLATALKNNEYVNVYVKDAAGNTSYATTINAPDTTRPLVPDAAFDTTGKNITGKAEPGSTVIVKNAAGTQLETTTANATTGEYSITLSTALINKETVKITAKDAAGNISDIKSLIAPDKTRPAAPSASINSTRKVITGSAEPGSIVEVKNTSGTSLGSVTANATTGAYTIALGTALTVNQTVNITAKDAAGNVSLPKSLTVTAVAKNLIPTSVLAATFDLGSMIASYEAEFENDAVFESSKVGRVADETVAMQDELKNLRSGGVNIDSLVQAIASFDPTAGMSLRNKSIPIDQHNLMLAVES